MVKRFIIPSLLFIAFGCHPSPRFTDAETYKPLRYKQESKNNRGEIYEKGVASYYAEDFHGKRTASGEIYNMRDLTAAHPSLPLGTVAKITNIKNGKNVIVKINDRMPKRGDRIIDLSLEAAKKLDLVLDGLAEVTIEIIE